MRLYRFIFRSYPSRKELSVLYLANNDWEFLTLCVDWAFDVSLPEQSLEEVVMGIGSQEDVAKVALWHEETALHYDAYARALREKSFNMGPDEDPARWESWEVSDEEAATLRRLHAISE